MPPALDRLLASPSALRLLRNIVTHPSPIQPCIACICPRRHHASSPPSSPKQWPRWKDRDANRTLSPSLNRPPVEDAAQLAEILQEETRRNRFDGIHEVWNLRKRCGLDLPTEETPEAKFLWGTFIKDHPTVDEVLEYAADLRQRTGQVYPRLYELCMTYWLTQPKHFRQALLHHQTMRRHLHLEKLPLRRLVQRNKGRLTGDMYDILLDIYRDSDEVDLYDEVVPELTRFPAKALSWHEACIEKADLPSPEVALIPAVKELWENGAATTKASGRPEPQMDEELQRRLRGRDTAPVRFHDSFCARMFATKALPPESAIQGLAFAGINEIGPLAIRTMASRTDPISDLPQRFEDLRAAGIALQGCVFSLALEKFAKEGHFFLVRSMLESDLHPEVYDDKELQEKLLEYYIKNEDWEQAHRTLAINSLFYTDSPTHAWNLLLENHIKRHAPEQISHTLKTMAQHQIPVDRSLPILLKRHLLQPRRQRKRPVQTKGGFDDLRFVARKFVFMLENKMVEISPKTWHEIMRRFGMAHRMRELRRLVYWLFCFYAPRGIDLPAHMRMHSFYFAAEQSSDRNTLPRPVSALPKTHPNHPLRQLFPDSFQQGLVVWGFRAHFLPNTHTEQSLFAPPASKPHHRSSLQSQEHLPRPSWDIGLQTLVELRRHSLYVNSATIAKALQMIFVNLFGNGHSTVPQNRIMEQANTMSYADYVARVNEIWGEKLFPEPRMYGISRLHGRMWHPRFDRNVNRKGHLKLSEIVEGIDGDGGDEQEREGQGVRITYEKTDLVRRVGVGMRDSSETPESEHTHQRSGDKLAERKWSW